MSLPAVVSAMQIDFLGPPEDLLRFRTCVGKGNFSVSFSMAPRNSLWPSLKRRISLAPRLALSTCLRARRTEGAMWTMHACRRACVCVPTLRPRRGCACRCVGIKCARTCHMIVRPAVGAVWTIHACQRACVCCPYPQASTEVRLFGSVGITYARTCL